MNLKIITILFILLSTLVNASATTATKFPTNYGCEPNKKNITYNAVNDYGVISGTNANQTPKLQAALYDIAKKGGGNLIIPEGEYHIAELFMCSNVHIQVSSKAVLKPYYTSKTYNVVMVHFNPGQQDSSAFIENTSISCLDKGEQYIVDYSEIDPDGSKKLCKVRFVVNRQVRNFMVADANIIDNYTKFCGIIFVGANAKENNNEEITRPTNGVIRNCKITNVSHGYGLCQLHAADSLLFENLSAKGGVTLRLEGHAGDNVGTQNIYGKNIYNEYGKAAVMFQPHVTHHGLVVVDGVRSKSSGFAVLIRAGFIDKQAKNDPNAEIGTFAKGCRITNISAEYGTLAQTEPKDFWIYEPEEAKYLKCVTKEGGAKQTEGASYAVVLDDTRGGYKVECSNIKFEGFPSTHPKSGIIYSQDLNRGRKDALKIIEANPSLK